MAVIVRAANVTGGELATMLRRGITLGVRKGPMKYFEDRLGSGRVFQDAATVHLQGAHVLVVRVASDLPPSRLDWIAAGALHLDNPAAPVRRHATTTCPEHSACRVYTVAVAVADGLDDELEALTSTTRGQRTAETASAFTSS